MKTLIVIVSLCVSFSLFAQISFQDKKTKKFGLKDQKGNVILKPTYDVITDFTEFGFAGVRLNGKIGCIDKTGAVIISLKYEYLEGNMFDNEWRAIVQKDNQWFLIDRDDNLVSKKYDKIQSDSDGLFQVNIGGKQPEPTPEDPVIYDFEGGKWGIIDYNGKEIIPVKYDFLGYFNDNEFADIELNGKRGKVSKKGIEHW